MKNAIALLIFLLCGTSMLAFAEMGPSNGGGGDVVILPNDDVVLADPFLDHGGSQPNNMPPLRALNPRILQAITSYTKFSEPVLNDLSRNGSSEIAQVMKQLSQRLNDLRFYAVQSSQELNTFCAPGGRKSYTLPDGATVQNVACTAGNETFLVEPLFIKLSIRDQALLLIHERLTTLRDAQGGKNYSAIARFTTGLKTFLNVGREQNLNSYRVLTTMETNQITEFYIATEEIERRNSDVNEDSFMWKAHIYGGGRVHLDTSVANDAIVCLFCKVNKKSFIQSGARIINSVVGQDSKIEDGAVLLNSNLNIRYELGRNSSVSNITTLNPSGIEFIHLNESANIESINFVCNEYCSINIGARTAIKSSIIQAHSFITQGDVRIVDTRVDAEEFIVGNSVELINSRIDLLPRKISLKDNQKMINGILNETSFEYAPQGYKIKPFSDSITFGSFLSPKIYFIKDIDIDKNRKQSKVWVKPGFTMKLSYDAKIKKDGLFSKEGWVEFSNCRIDLNVTSGETAPFGLYSIYDGIISKASVRRVINFWTPVHDSEISQANIQFMNALYKLAVRNGFTVIDDKIELPIEIDKTIK
ncbi:MAG: hypothetical protein ACXVDC_12790 [Bacteroidia bacterium]